MTRHRRRPQPVVAYRPTAGVLRLKDAVAEKSGKTLPWYSINASGATAEVMIYDAIGQFGVTAQDFIAELNALKGVTRVDLHVSSPGGDVFDAIAIYNALRRNPAYVTSYVDGLAASAASFIIQAGDKVLIEPQGTIMIHEAAGLCVGNAADMRELAALLDKTSDTIASIYAGAAGGSVAEWRTVMKAETWYTADEAVAAGLADEVLPADAPRNSAPLREFAARLEWDRLTASLLQSPRPGSTTDELLKNILKQNGS